MTLEQTKAMLLLDTQQKDMKKAKMLAKIELKKILGNSSKHAIKQKAQRSSLLM